MIKKIIIFVLLFFWEFIQNMVAIFFIFLNIRKIKKIFIERLSFVIYIDGYKIFFKKRPGNALGRFIILDKVYWGNRYIINHEYGHTIQSLLLGPLYLFLVMIPSYINYIKSIKNKEYRKKYYEKYPEKWANKLGGN